VEAQVQLTAKYLHDTLRALRSSQSIEVEKRRMPRVGLRVRADIWHPRRGAMNVWLRDLSMGGANFAVPVEMSVGDELHFLLADGTPGSKDQPDKITCRVRHCRKLATNMYAVGVKFDNPPGETN
jgi:hypothetical protein